MLPRISKSRYMSGLQCAKRLWLELHAPDKAAPISEAQQRIFDQGTEVGIEARNRFPNGRLIQVTYADLDQNVRETEQALAEDVPTIFEATFFFDYIYVVSDVITKNGDGSWNLFEVKSSTKVHDEHIYDLAVQKYVLENSGLTIDKVNVMHINNQCRYPDLSNLFARQDVTPQVERVSQEVPLNLAAFKALVRQKREPDVLIGPHCVQPHECPFKEYCWRTVGKKAVFDIPKLPNAQKTDLWEKGITSLDQLPPNYPLKGEQWAYVNRIMNDGIEIDAAAIKARLAELEYPLYFFDFETDNPALPKFDGARPYQQIPFQYSCHVMGPDGQLEHYEYLHEDETDPRLPLTQSLLNCIKDKGSVIAYNARFERGVLLDLADSLPQYAPELRSIINRLWDQLEIFKHHYKHAAFGKSNSIKKVLPVVVPALNYGELEVHKGDQAQSVWSMMLRTSDRVAKDRMAQNLKSYCKLDTLAMVEIHRVLQGINGNS